MMIEGIMNYGIVNGRDLDGSPRKLYGRVGGAMGKATEQL